MKTKIESNGYLVGCDNDQLIEQAKMLRTQTIAQLVSQAGCWIRQQLHIGKQVTQGAGFGKTAASPLVGKPCH